MTMIAAIIPQIFRRPRNAQVAFIPRDYAEKHESLQAAVQAQQLEIERLRSQNTSLARHTDNLLAYVYPAVATGTMTDPERKAAAAEAIQIELLLRARKGSRQ